MLETAINEYIQLLLSCFGKEWIEVEETNLIFVYLEIYIVRKEGLLKSLHTQFRGKSFSSQIKKTAVQNGWNIFWLLF